MSDLWLVWLVRTFAAKERRGGAGGGCIGTWGGGGSVRGWWRWGLEGDVNTGAVENCEPSQGPAPPVRARNCEEAGQDSMAFQANREVSHSDVEWSSRNTNILIVYVVCVFLAGKGFAERQGQRISRAGQGSQLFVLTDPGTSLLKGCCPCSSMLSRSGAAGETEDAGDHSGWSPSRHPLLVQEELSRLRSQLQHREAIPSAAPAFAMVYFCQLSSRTVSRRLGLRHQNCTLHTFVKGAKLNKCFACRG